MNQAGLGSKFQVQASFPVHEVAEQYWVEDRVKECVVAKSD